MKNLLCALLVFYFALTAGEGAGRVIGPFATLLSCETTARQFAWKTACWEGK